MGKVNEQAVIELIIKGEQSKSTIKEVRTTMIGLERQLSNMKKADDPAGFEKLRKELIMTKQAYGQMMAEIRGSEGSLKSFKLSWKDIFGGVVGGNIATQAIQKLVSSIPALVNRGGDLSDMLADVQKETNLTSDALGQLDQDLRKINTRTPIEKLYGLAEIAGKLGYESKDDVLEFVKAANMLDVALSKSLGGNTEEAINDIGKLVEIFGLKEDFGIEKAMLKVGSAINTVGASSAANEGYLVNWSKRFAGIAPNAGISISDTIGMAAAADILGQSAEQSATNIGKMIIALGKDVPYFAKVAKMGVKEFSNLLKIDGNEAFLRVLEGAKSTTKGVEGLTKTLETLGIEGSEGAQVLGALTKNIDLVRQQQDIANKSFAEGTSVLNEYNVKNQNSGAILEKIGKVIGNWWDKAAAGMNPMIQLFGRWFGVVTELEIKMGEFNAQQNKVIAAESKLPALIKRYNELSINTNKSAEEQDELRKIMEQIAEVVPTAAYEFDQYGNVLGIDTRLVQEFIFEQKNLLETMRTARKEEIVHDKLMLTRRAARLQESLNRGTISDTDVETGSTVERKMRADEIVAARKELAQLQKDKMEIIRTEREISGLAARAAGRAAKGGGSTVKQNNAPGAGGSGGSTLSKDEAKKAADAAKALNDDLMRNQQQLTLAAMEGQEKELQAAQYKYDALKEKAKGNAAALKTIEEQRVQEVGQIQDKYVEKFAESADKIFRGQLKFQNEQAKAKSEFERDQAEKSAALTETEFEKLERKYAAELAAAEVNGFDKLEIQKRYFTELNQLMQKQSAKEIADYADTQEKKKKADEAAKDAKEKAYRSEMQQIENVHQAAEYGGEAIGNILSLTAKNQEQNAEFQKAVALFQIAVDTSKAISAAIATAAAGGDGYTIALRIFAAVAAVTGAILQAKQVLSTAQEPKAPAFRADGGPTDLGSIRQDTTGNPQGWVTQPTLFRLGRRSYVAGEAGAEYVVSNPMLRNPAVADFVNGLEALRTQRYFASGGSTAMVQGNAQQPGVDMREVVRWLRVIAAKPDSWNFATLEQYQNGVNDVRNRANA